ncbi:MAG: pyridoxal-phosphate dependent enzyme [Bacteroidetes bacterium]|nr:pyridoxal-phosphate dependent enzyme [Bacteroidota bacterium]
MNTPAVTALDILHAHEIIKPYIHKTQVLTNSTLNNLFKCELYFKCENFQKAGAFKSRGATNAVFSLNSTEMKMGVATHSSGNHAQALARAARLRNIKAYLVMPANSAKVKVEAVKGYGGEIHFCIPTLEARESTLEEVIRQTGAIEIHPYNDARIIAGQATAAKEMLEDIPALDVILAPVGGGGLLSGTALSAAYFSPSTRVIGVEPEMAQDAFISFKQKQLVPSVNPDTIADGLRTSLGSLTFPIILDHVSDIITVSERSIIEAMRLIWERMKIVIEPSSAVPLAGLLEKKIELKGLKAGIILSGGNVDLAALPW